VLVPVIDVAPLVQRLGDARAVASEIDRACRASGFFLITGHGVDAGLCERLELAARAFFELADDQKAAIAMARGGRAWRGWFPVGGELTSGIPDRKEGIYFGAEHGADHPRVAAGVPLHGANLFPEHPAALRSTVLEYLDAMTDLGHALMRGVALALELPEDWFARHLTQDPTILFRMFHYPPARRVGIDTGQWGVAEHTDYGLLTILLQDHTGGLQVHGPDGWIDVAPEPGTFVCNLGDMLERMTGGRYRSTPHRVRNTSDAERVSFAFFFDPSWDAEVQPIPGLAAEGAAPGRPRWDEADLESLRGTYGEYLLHKVAKVFPDLGTDVL
jgi:isopenicillin N synthase-like dioxygenase